MTYTFASATILLLLITDPFGNIPIFASALRPVPPARRPWVILREVLIAFVLLLTFMFVGDRFLRLMNLSDLSLQIAGGVVLFLIALRMIFPPPPSQVAVPQGEPLTLLLDVSGAGNIKSVSDPAWPAMRDFKVYDSTSSSDVSKEGGVVRGKKSWQQILVPLKAGDLTVAPVRFAYFDPRSDRYEILETSPLNVRVTPAATPAGGGVGTPATRGAIEVVGQDIRFIHTGKTAFQSRGRRAWDGPFFWLMAFLPVGVMAGSLAFDRHRRRLEQDLGFARGVRSGREAGRRLKKARQLLASPDAAFFTETADALRGYVADRFNRAAAGLTLEEIRALLVGRQQRPELIERVVQLLENCDMARYAPAAAASLDRARLLDDAGALIETLKKEGV